jgi:membrane dipeptidase
VVDLVVGTALFRHAFLTPSPRGHVDLPRLRAAGVNVIGLTLATRFPDLRGSLSRWHFRSLGLPRAARSNMAIAEWHIGRIEGWCAASGGQLRILRRLADLAACLAEGGPVGILLGVQGGHVLDGDLRNVTRLRELGVRMLAPAHVMDNALVGSGTGRRRGGLTTFGREGIAEMEAQGIVVDLAHMSLPGIEDALPLMRRPSVLSHTGLTEMAGTRSRWRRYSPATRNIPSSVAREIGQAGGLVGVILATGLLGGDELSDAVATIRLAVQSAGIANVAVGSDMDGALRTVIDAAGLPALTDALLQAGIDRSIVEGVMGGNAVRLLKEALEE